ncbi:hypothetical protein Cni_G02570 [Canna indica]|uniref:MULE transposase domain-containing protein n=1 Tax=Canna indica TaxID=4628 RepID=A0AAQ3JRG3_9LILI|nr:hypothetical protein Cni_G02570 [Canna indica]
MSLAIFAGASPRLPLSPHIAYFLRRLTLTSIKSTALPFSSAPHPEAIFFPYFLSGLAAASPQRPIIRFDGCLLKIFLGGQLLSAIGRDNNNQMFPIAWAIVEGENYDSWSWFLGILFDDLFIDQGYGWALISDRQKYAIKQRFPAAEHRNCARHVYTNWKKKHNRHELKSAFWRIVRCTAESEFKRALNELQVISPPTFQDFIAIGVQKFCQAFISPQCKYEVLTSNICETFNGCILRARSKLLIDMLDDIRRKLSHLF